MSAEKGRIRSQRPAIHGENTSDAAIAVRSTFASPSGQQTRNWFSGGLASKSMREAEISAQPSALGAVYEASLGHLGSLGMSR